MRSLRSWGESNPERIFFSKSLRFSNHTEDAVIRPGKFGPWDSLVEYDFIFRDIDPADVKRVLLTNSKGTCWV